MTSDRPYRPAVTVDGAIAELRHCAGTHFDPQVVETLVEAVREQPLAGSELDMPTIAVPWPVDPARSSPEPG
jgi:HD-GYP domain-containing protein (c-di-GMP phosphodiesterase class II)